jgi:hypothetical protein
MEEGAAKSTSACDQVAVCVSLRAAAANQQAGPHAPLRTCLCVHGCLGGSCRTTILSTVSDSAREQLAAITSDETLLSTYLVVERALGQASEWHPYLQVCQASPCMWP